MYVLWRGEDTMKYQVTWTGTWNTEIEADSREEATEILERDWDNINPLAFLKEKMLETIGYDLEADIEEEGYDD